MSVSDPPTPFHQELDELIVPKSVAREVMRRAKNPGTNIGDGLAAVQRTVELQESFLRYIFGLCRIAESCHHVAMYQAAPLLKIACDFLFERQSILVERKE